MVSFSGEGLTDSRAQGPRRILQESGGGPGGGKWGKSCTPCYAPVCIQLGTALQDAVGRRI